jgi:hypothetical protein
MIRKRNQKELSVKLRKMTSRVVVAITTKEGVGNASLNAGTYPGAPNRHYSALHLERERLYWPKDAEESPNTPSGQCCWQAQGRP